MLMILSLKKTKTAFGEYVAIKENHMKKTAILLIVILLSFSANSYASWLVFHKPEYKGKVVDVDTNEPIEGAVVVAIYRKVQMAIGDAVDRNIGAQEILTDKNGEFTIPPYTAFMNPFSWDNTVDFYVFKPGYASLGHADLEEKLSGFGKNDSEFPAHWNQTLKFRVLKAGIIMLPRVTGKDRLESFRNFYWGENLRANHPIASKMRYEENLYILTLK